jgi:hypothetical protein
VVLLTREGAAAYWTTVREFRLLLPREVGYRLSGHNFLCAKYSMEDLCPTEYIPDL